MTVRAEADGGRSAQLLGIMARQMGVEVDVFLRRPGTTGPLPAASESPSPSAMLARLLRAWRNLPSDEDRHRVVTLVEAGEGRG